MAWDGGCWLDGVHMEQRKQFIVEAGEVGLRLDRYLTRHLPNEWSRAAIQRSIHDGAVMVAGQLAKAHRLVKAGETIDVQLDEARPSAVPDFLLRAEPIPLDIVYEDDQLLVVNKPPGLVTHPAPGHWSGTLVNAVLWHLKQTPDSRLQTLDSSPESRVWSLESPLPRAGIVHRLDKDTSGLLVVAKTGPALRALSTQLKHRTMSRRYIALVEGVMELQEGTINAAVGRHLRHRKQMAVRYLGGRQAVSHYRVLARVEAHAKRLESRVSSPESKPFSYSVLEVRLETGRTHQVRVHLAHLGHPVLGDVVYGRHPSSYWQAQGITRQLLHAAAIRFTHPTRHDDMALHAPLPVDMRSWVGDVAEQLKG